MLGVRKQSYPIGGFEITFCGCICLGTALAWNMEGESSTVMQVIHLSLKSVFRHSGTLACKKIELPLCMMATFVTHYAKAACGRKLCCSF